MNRHWAGTIAVLVAVLLVITNQSDAQQTVRGRSNAGAITPAYEDHRSGAAAATHPLAFQIEFSEPSGNSYLDARETGRLRLRITNGGRMTVRGVVAKVVPLTPPSSLSYSDSIIVGDVHAGSTRYAIFYFTARDEVPAQIATFQVELMDAQGPVADPRLLTFLTRPKGDGSPQE